MLIWLLLLCLTIISSEGKEELSQITHTPVHGKLEVLFNNQMSICSDKFSSVQADGACKLLGYENAEEYKEVETALSIYSEVTTHIVLSMSCNASEEDRMMMITCLEHKGENGAHKLKTSTIIVIVVSCIIFVVGSCLTYFLLPFIGYGLYKIKLAICTEHKEEKKILITSETCPINEEKNQADFI